MLVHRRVTSSIKFASNHLYPLVERGTVRVKYFTQEHNKVYFSKARCGRPFLEALRGNYQAC